MTLIAGAPSCTPTDLGKQVSQGSPPPTERSLSPDEPTSPAYPPSPSSEGSNKSNSNNSGNCSDESSSSSSSDSEGTSSNQNVNAGKAGVQPCAYRRQMRNITTGTALVLPGSDTDCERDAVIDEHNNMIVRSGRLPDSQVRYIKKFGERLHENASDDDSSVKYSDAESESKSGADDDEPKDGEDDPGNHEEENE